MRGPAWHTADGDPEEETLLELHLVSMSVASHYHEDVQAHDGLRPHQHAFILSRLLGERFYAR